MEERREPIINPGLYGPWHSIEREPDFEDEDDWIEYLRRNMDHSAEHDTPFPGSWWSYARQDASFDEGLSREQNHFVHLADEQLTDEIDENLYHNPKLDASGIEVIAMNGNISLTGHVDSERDLREASRIVEKVPGVWSVNNELRI